MAEDNESKVHWADAIAQELIAEKPEQEVFTVAAGITPSGVVHIGNFRETVTVDLVAKALMHAGKKVRFIYSWDDYDVFRKVPGNMPEQEMLTKHLRYPIVDVPDPFGNEDSYARHNEVAVESDLPLVGVNPEFLYQAKKYRASEYAEEIKTAMQKRMEIKAILDKFRKEPLGDDWYPSSIFCTKCSHDETKITAYDGEYNVTYNCKCGNEETIDIRKNGSIKLLWRIDWPMRWSYEKVDFEPSGKEHSSSGGSNTTAEMIVKEIFGREPPKHTMYEFISIKGAGGKMSSSKGNTITLGEMLKVYQPEIIRMLFASKLPKKYFEVSFEGMDVIRLYDEFHKLERTYFGEEEVKEEDKELNNRFYELSSVKVPDKIPSQISFRHVVTLLQIFQGDEAKVAEGDKNYVAAMISRAKYWLDNYAEDQFKFIVQTEVSKEAIKDLTDAQKASLKELASKLGSQTEEEIVVLFKEIMDSTGLKPKEFFQACYTVLINKNFGPQLSGFLLTIGLNNVKALFEQV